MPKRKKDKSCSENCKRLLLEEDDDGPVSKYDVNIGESTRKVDEYRHVRLVKFYEDMVNQNEANFLKNRVLHTI